MLLWPAKFSIDVFNIIMVAAALDDDPDLRIYSRPYHRFFQCHFGGLFAGLFIDFRTQDNTRNQQRLNKILYYLHSIINYIHNIFTRRNGSEFQTRFFTKIFSFSVPV